jgi:AcrR family transcriptional regulator
VSARAATLTPKAARTRARIEEAALELFRESGYDAATMRAVAERAGVSTGNAYYYFASKDHLVQAYYARSHEEHVAACTDLLATEKSFEKRLRGVLRAKVDVTAPYHRFAGGLFGAAADPDSPLNPFGEDSRETREAVIAFMGDVYAGSRQKVPSDLAEELPYLLWLYLMGVVLFWIHDRSPGTERTYRLVDRTAEIVARLVKLASNPLLSPLRRAALRLLAELRPGAAPRD